MSTRTRHRRRGHQAMRSIPVLETTRDAEPEDVDSDTAPEPKPEGAEEYAGRHRREDR